MKRGPAAALALLAGVLVAWMAWNRNEAPPRTTATTPSPTRAPAPPPSARASTPTVRPATPLPTDHDRLPPPTTPLRESFAVLDAQARGGRAEAACRLVEELQRCLSARSTSLRHTPLERRLELIEQTSLEDAEKQRLRDRARNESAALDADLAHCEGFDAQRAPPPMRYVAISARAGHRLSRLLYLMPTSLLTADLIRDPALAAEYRATAPALFRAALEAGDVDVLVPWEFAADERTHAPLASLLPEELRRAGVVRALREELQAAGHAVPPSLAAGLTPAAPPSREDVEAARALFDAHFRGAATPPPLHFVDYITAENLRCDEVAGR